MAGTGCRRPIEKVTWNKLKRMSLSPRGASSALLMERSVCSPHGAFKRHAMKFRWVHALVACQTP